MPAIAITVLIAFFVIAGALAALGIGLLLTGKPKIKPGACGRDPNRSRDEACGSKASCMLCDKHEQPRKQADEEQCSLQDQNSAKTPSSENSTHE